MENTYIDHYTITSYHADFTQKMSPVSLFCFLQDSAGKHAHSKGFGWHHLAEKQQFWVLAKIHAVVHRIPQWKEEIRLETWGKQPELLTAFRDFELFDKDNNILVSVVSSWHILDMLSHRPIMTDGFAKNFPIADKYALDKKPSKITLPDTKAIQGNTFPVKPSDIDMNLHVNNTRYIQWATDEIPFAFRQSHQLAEIDVNFVHEATLNDFWYIDTHQDETTFTQAVISKNDGRTLALVKSKWKAQ